MTSGAHVAVVSDDVAEQSLRAIDNTEAALKAAVSAARVAGLGVPGALVEVSAIAARM